VVSGWITLKFFAVVGEKVWVLNVEILLGTYQLR
jgi:hypothetical protein